MTNQKLKRCPKCEQTLSTKDFYLRRGVDASPYCKKCMNKLTTERGQKRKLEAIAYKGGKCMICKYDKHQNSLDFHHTDPSTKESTFSKLRWKKWSTYKEELDKCILVCSNCHGEIHAGLHPQYLIVKDQL